VIDGGKGLRRALQDVFGDVAVIQRCQVHKLRNLERKTPKHVLDGLRADFHRIVYAMSAETARMAWAAFERTWGSGVLAWSRASRKRTWSC
jgi:transposase-like protein